jgi:hypothetical protein
MENKLMPFRDIQRYHGLKSRIVILSYVPCQICPPSVYGSLTGPLLTCRVFGECYKFFFAPEEGY